MDKSFEKIFSLNLNRIKTGLNHEQFELNGDFFSHFENTPVQDCGLKADLEIHRTDSHIDVKFHIHGYVVVSCDRCADDMKLPLDTQERVIYSFSEKMKDAGDTEVLYVDEKATELTLVQELYDFVCIALPFRKVHEDIGENCDPEIMKYIISDSGDDDNEKEIDPRWESLKNINKKDQ
ncbi:MAG: DUF177 domain-containing protein [Bacteroidia bacterium]|nr:DUF177 domain-containing protein [Bacteroidia bacterium]